MFFMGKTMVSGRFSQPIHSAKVLPQRPPGRTRPSGRWHGATGRPPYFWMVGRSCIDTVYVYILFIIHIIYIYIYISLSICVFSIYIYIHMIIHT